MNVKICGITRVEDAALAVRLGAWALGFIFYPKSPRYVSPERARTILEALPPSPPFRKVGVFVDADVATIRNVARESGIDTIQLHGDEDPAFCSSLSDLILWKAIRLGSANQFAEAKAFEPFVEALLFDASVPGQHGGTGQTVDWELLAQFPRTIPLIVSGGLNSGNALRAWERFQPYALDLSSGVESSPGIKDHDKLNRLMASSTKGG